MDLWCKSLLCSYYLDCNARTGCLLDYLAVDTFINDLTGFEDESGMNAFHGTALNIHRYNKDTVVNTYSDLPGRKSKEYQW